MLGPPEEPFQSLRRVPHMVEMSYCCLAGELQQFFVHSVQVKQLENPDTVFDAIVGLVVCFAEHGLIHCDFNEFNIMINDNEEVTMIDFPQMLSVSHRNAQMYFDRDVECIYKFFSKSRVINTILKRIRKRLVAWPPRLLLLLIHHVMEKAWFPCIDITLEALTLATTAPRLIS
ncbi:serine/threonine-protein kinase rio2-like isoform X5 [Magnolia sinica]|uniref:serine/threonine-protein kinase rio2-like isoform X5 n=1 Tax=Magnolia sinica TaxID=86752 RepID=UPI0026594EE5|nr:serine/threonine-protein kinase rio2-like isoform X5 [Magnolia sinica]